MSALTLAPAAVVAVGTVGIEVLAASATAAWALVTGAISAVLAVGTVGTSLLATDAIAVWVLALTLAAAAGLALSALALTARITGAPAVEGVGR